MVDPDIDAIFLREAERRLAEVERILSGPFPRRGSRELSDLQRHAHSLKGAAGTLGHSEVESAAGAVWRQLDEEARGAARPEDIEDDVRREFEKMRAEIDRALHK